MRGSTFLALFLILTGVTFIVATLRGRAPVLYDAIAEGAGASSEGPKGGSKGGRQKPSNVRSTRRSVS